MAPFGQLALYGFFPALAGFAAGLAMAVPAFLELRRKAPEAMGRGLVLAMLLTTAPMFTFIATFMAAGRPRDGSAYETPLLVLGGASIVTNLIQGFLARGLMPKASAPEQFGKALVACVFPEMIVLGAFIWTFLQISGH